MTSIDIKFDEFISNFHFVEVYGRYMPSRESIKIIFNEIDDDVIRHNFLENNNDCVNWVNSIKNSDSLDIFDFAFRGLIEELHQNYQTQYKLLGCDEFELFWQSFAFIYFFDMTVAVKLKAKNIQTQRRESSALRQELINNETIEFEDSDPTLSPRYEYSLRFPEYAKALEIVNQWHNKIGNLLNENPKLRKLIIATIKIHNLIKTNREKCEGLHSNVCPFCHRLSIKEDRGKIATCGSEKCEKMYFAATKRKSRSRAVEIAKRSNPPQAIGGEDSRCDECGKRRGKKRVLYQFTEGNFCKPCCITILNIW